MTADEWAGTVKWMEGVFKGEITEKQEFMYYRSLKDFSKDQVDAAIDMLILEGQVFMPVPGELVKKMIPPVPTFDSIWSAIWKVITSASSYGEKGCIERVRETAGDLAAGWLATYGAIRLSQEPLRDEDVKGMILSRLQKSYVEATSDIQQRRLLVERMERVLGPAKRPLTLVS